MPDPRVSVIIPARDAAVTLGATLAALAGQEGAPPFEVIVVDDGSSDATATLARAAGVRVVDGAGEGPARARNRGVAAACGAILAFTDADCAPEPRWLRAGVAALDTGADIVQGPVRPSPSATIGPWDRTVRFDRPTGLFETANLFVRRATFVVAGGFESWLGPRHGKELGEDAWLGWRCVRAGARSAWAAEAGVVHSVFARRAVDHVAERERLRHFPALVARLPELREALTWRRCFLSRRSASFDLAAAGLVGAFVLRRPLLAAAAGPYVAVVAGDAQCWDHLAGRVAVAGVAADAVGALALCVGSLEARTVLL